MLAVGKGRGVYRCHATTGQELFATFEGDNEVLGLDYRRGMAGVTQGSWGGASTSQAHSWRPFDRRLCSSGMGM